MIVSTVCQQIPLQFLYADFRSHYPELKSRVPAQGKFELFCSNAFTLQQQEIVVHDSFNYMFTLGTYKLAAQVKVRLECLSGVYLEKLEGLQAYAEPVTSGVGNLGDEHPVIVVALSTSEQEVQYL